MLLSARMRVLYRMPPPSRLVLLITLLLISSQFVFAEVFAEDEQTPTENYKAAIGFGVEINMNSPENFAGAALFNFDVNIARQFALGINVTGNTNFSGITVLEFSGMFRWYFLSLKHDGWFAQINAGYNHVDIEGAPIALISELRGGIRIPMGNFYIEPYGRVGYPVVWGAGVVAVAGIRMPTIKRVKETKLDQNLTGEALAENIASFLVVLNAVKPENITTVGYGADRPIASNATPEGMAANRRIEITILED